MRKHGIESLEMEKAGISVFMTEEEEEKEPDFKTPMASRPVDREFNSQMKARLERLINSSVYDRCQRGSSTLLSMTDLSLSESVTVVSYTSS